MRPIYLDYNATTPIDPEVAAAMRPYLEDRFGNPSSAHRYGTRARRAVEDSRTQVAEFLECAPAEVIFTSGGSESNNLAIKGVAQAHREHGNHIITSAVEHPAVTQVCRYLEREGARVTTLRVDGQGLVDPGEVARAITPETILVTIMHANNEVGTIQRITEIAEAAHERGVLLHTDAAQSAGKIAVRIGELNADLLSLAGHKLYAPKGVGALYVRAGVTLEKQIHGADHERNLRAGTENVLGIVGLGKACTLAARDLEDHARHMRAMRDRLHQRLSSRPGLRLNGHPRQRLPNTVSVSLAGIEASALLSKMEEVAASAGAACHSDSVAVSHVLAAMGVPLEQAIGTVRLSVGRFTTADEVDRAARIILETAARMRPRVPRGTD